MQITTDSVYRKLFFVMMLLNIGAAGFNIYAFSRGGMLRWVNLGCVFVSAAFALFMFHYYRKVRT